MVKKVRLTPAQARDLDRLARALRVTESDILREGIEAARQRDRRRRAVEEMIRMTEGESYRKIPFSLR